MQLGSMMCCKKIGMLELVHYKLGMMIQCKFGVVMQCKLGLVVDCKLVPVKCILGLVVEYKLVLVKCRLVLVECKLVVLVECKLGLVECKLVLVESMLELILVHMSFQQHQDYVHLDILGISQKKRCKSSLSLYGKLQAKQIKHMN